MSNSGTSKKNEQDLPSDLPGPEAHDGETREFADLTEGGTEAAEVEMPADGDEVATTESAEAGPEDTVAIEPVESFGAAGDGDEVPTADAPAEADPFDAERELAATRAFAAEDVRDGNADGGSASSETLAFPAETREFPAETPVADPGEPGFGAYGSLPASGAPADPYAATGLRSAMFQETYPGTSTFAPDPYAPSSSAPDLREQDRGPRVTTIVWGLILALLGAGIVTSQVTDLNVDTGVATIGFVALAGLLLIIGAIVSAARSGRRRG